MSVSVKNQGTGAQGNVGDNQGNASQEGDTPKGESTGQGSGSTVVTEGGATDGDGDELDVSKLPPKAQKLIKDLRNENAGSRQKNKQLSDSHSKLKKSLVEAGLIEDDEEAPEEKVKTVSAMNDSLAVQKAILEKAIEHGVGKADLKFFQFLVADRASQLDEDGELTDDDIAEIAKLSMRSQPQGSSSTSVTQGGNTPQPGASGSTTLDQFVKMNIGEKTQLFLKNKDLYEQLKNQAKAKKILV